MLLTKGLQPHHYVRGRHLCAFEVLGREEDSWPPRGLALARLGGSTVASQHSSSTAGYRASGEWDCGKTKSNLGQTKVCLAQRSFRQ